MTSFWRSTGNGKRFEAGDTAPERSRQRKGSVCGPPGIRVRDLIKRRRKGVEDKESEERRFIPEAPSPEDITKPRNAPAIKDFRPAAGRRVFGLGQHHEDEKIIQTPESAPHPGVPPQGLRDKKSGPRGKIPREDLQLSGQVSEVKARGNKDIPRVGHFPVRFLPEHQDARKIPKAAGLKKPRPRDRVKYLSTRTTNVIPRNTHHGVFPDIAIAMMSQVVSEMSPDLTRCSLR